LEIAPVIRSPYYWDGSSVRPAANIGWSVSSFPASEISSNNAAGRQMYGPNATVSGAYATNYNAVFPAAGNRYHSGNSLNSVGVEAFYWGCAPVLSIEFDDSEIMAAIGYNDNFGFSVRCILDE
jgi:hypothetical protein